MNSQLLAQDYELVPIGELTPHPENPRKGNLDAIERSIAEHGFYGACVVQRSTGHILAGNHRWEAAKREGLTAVPVIWVDVNNQRARQILLADNKVNDMAGYDEGALATILLDLRAADALQGSQYTEEDLGKLLKSMGDAILDAGAEPPVDLQESDDLPDAPETSVTIMGDKWMLGDHRLLCGDATDPKNVKNLCGGDVIQLVFTDPPYNVDYEGYTKQELTILNDKMTPAAFLELLNGAFASYAKVLAPTGSMYCCHSVVGAAWFQGAIEAAGFEVRTQIIWAKNTFAWGFARYKFQHEPIFYCHLKGESDSWYGDKSQSTLWQENKPASNRLHPTMKPVELVQRALLNSSRKGELVADFFGGAGSTLIASEVLKRRARLMEIDPKYCDVIVERWQKLSGKQAVLEGAGQTFAQVSATRSTVAAAKKVA
jgi:DNA modification methylase